MFVNQYQLSKGFLELAYIYCSGLLSLGGKRTATELLSAPTTAVNIFTNVIWFDVAKPTVITIDVVNKNNVNKKQRFRLNVMMTSYFNSPCKRPIMYSWISYWLPCLTTLFNIPITSIISTIPLHYCNKFGWLWRPIMPMTLKITMTTTMVTHRIFTWNNFVYVNHPIVLAFNAWTGRIKTKYDSILIDSTVLFYSGTTKMTTFIYTESLYRGYMGYNVETSRCRSCM